jgi:hypothetical protein
MKRKKPRKYQKKLSLYPMTFEQVVDKVLAFKPKREKKSNISAVPLKVE